MNKEQLQAEIAQLEPRAQAEQWHTIGRPNQVNPWAGASERLERAKAQLEDLGEAEAAQQFMQQLAAYESGMRMAKNLETRARVEEIHQTIAAIDKNLIHRWQREASHLNSTDWLTQWAAKTFTDLASNPNAPVPRNTLPFTDSELREIAKYVTLDAEAKKLSSARLSGSIVMDAAAKQYPALKDLAQLDVASSVR